MKKSLPLLMIIAAIAFAVAKVMAGTSLILGILAILIAALAVLLAAKGKMIASRILAFIPAAIAAYQCFSKISTANIVGLAAAVILLVISFCVDEFGFSDWWWSLKSFFSFHFSGSFKKGGNPFDNPAEALKKHGKNAYSRGTVLAILFVFAAIYYAVMELHEPTAVEILIVLLIAAAIIGGAYIVGLCFYAFGEHIEKVTIISNSMKNIEKKMEEATKPQSN